MSSDAKPDTPLTSLTKCLHLIATPSMLILLPYFCYIGFNFSFRTGVYGPSLSFARTFDDADGDNHNLTGTIEDCSQSHYVKQPIIE